MPSHQTGLLIIRGWIEEDSTEPLRALIRLTNDISTGIERTLTLTDSDAIGDLVNAWLQHILRGATDAAGAAGGDC